MLAREFPWPGHRRDNGERRFGDRNPAEVDLERGRRSGPGRELPQQAGSAEKARCTSRPAGLDKFVHEASAFGGAGQPHDDQLDAASWALIGLQPSTAVDRAVAAFGSDAGRAKRSDDLDLPRWDPCSRLFAIRGILARPSEEGHLLRPIPHPIENTTSCCLTIRRMLP
jgi:hypothetical protein